MTGASEGKGRVKYNFRLPPQADEKNVGLFADTVYPEGGAI